MGRPVTPDDFLNIVKSDEFSWSPDGTAIAYTLSDPKKNSYRVHKAGLHSGTDVWIAGPWLPEPKRISTGESDVSYWGPAWSPDGTKVAFLVTHGAKVSLFLWDRENDRTRNLSGERNVDPSAEVGTPSFLWESNHQILCVTRDGNDPSPYNGSEAQSSIVFHAAHNWQLAARNELASVAVDTSLLAATKPSDSMPTVVSEAQELTEIDTVSGAQTHLGGNVDIREVSLSADGSRIALFEGDRVANQSCSLEWATTRLNSTTVLELSSKWRSA